MMAINPKGFPVEPEPEPQDEWPATVADVDQHVAMAPQFCRMMAAEFNALLEEGVGPFFAAIIIGTRFKMGSSS